MECHSGESNTELEKKKEWPTYATYLDRNAEALHFNWGFIMGSGGFCLELHLPEDMRLGV